MLLVCLALSTSVHYIRMHLVLRMVVHMVVIQCLESFPFQFCSVTSCHVSCRWWCASYQLWSTGSQLYMHPGCHSDYLFVSTGRGTPSGVPTHACTPVVLSPSLGIPWTCRICVVSTGPSPRSGDHDRCCQCLLVLSGGPMLQWCWLECCRVETVRLLYTLYADGCVCGKEAFKPSDMQ